MVGLKEIDDTGKDYETGDNDQLERNDEASGNDEACENDESCMILSVFGLDAANFCFEGKTTTNLKSPSALFSSLFSALAPLHKIKRIKQRFL